MMENDIKPPVGIGGLISNLKIRTKLISIISLILITSLTGIIILATYFFKSDNEIRANELNHKIAEITSLNIQTDFAALVEKLNLMGNTMIQQFPQKALFTDLFFTNDRNMIYVGIGTRMGAIIRFDNAIYSRPYFYENRLNDAAISRIRGIYTASFARAFNNEAL